MDRPLKRAVWRSRPALIGMAAAAVVVVGSAAGLLANVVGAAGLRVDADTIRIDTATNGVFKDFAPVSAKAIAGDLTYLDAREGGQVDAVLARAGDLVQADQPLVRFQNRALELDVLDRQTQIIQQISQLENAEQQLETTRTQNLKSTRQAEYEIMRLARSVSQKDILFSKDLISAEAHRQAHEELDFLKRQLPLQHDIATRDEALRLRRAPDLRAELVALRKALVLTRGRLDDLVLAAPRRGRISGMDLTIGQHVAPGQRLGQITPETGFRLMARLDEYYLGRVRSGQAADIQTGGRTYQAMVVRVDPQVTDGRFGVELAFTGPAPAVLTPGQALEGRITLGGDRRALLLPAGPFLDATGGDWAMVLAADGKSAGRRQLRVGQRNAEQVEILSGLSPGERVITSDYAAFEKIQRVTLAK